MRRDALYVQDMVAALDAIAAFIDGKVRDDLRVSELLQSAVLQKLTIIGEAAARVSPDLKLQFPEIEWRQIVRFRNIIVHQYFGLDWEIVWIAAAQECPALRQKLLPIQSALRNAKA